MCWGKSEELQLHIHIDMDIYIQTTASLSHPSTNSEYNIKPITPPNIYYILYGNERWKDSLSGIANRLPLQKKRAFRCGVDF